MSEHDDANKNDSQVRGGGGINATPEMERLARYLAVNLHVASGAIKRGEVQQSLGEFYGKEQYIEEMLELYKDEMGLIKPSDNSPNYIEQTEHNDALARAALVDLVSKKIRTLGDKEETKQGLQDAFDYILKNFVRPTKVAGKEIIEANIEDRSPAEQNYLRKLIEKGSKKDFADIADPSGGQWARR